MKDRKSWTIYVLLALLLLQGIGAVAGGLLLAIKPDGSLLHMPLSALQGSIFPNYLIPGVILLAVLGLFPLFTFAILIRRPRMPILQALSIYSDRYFGWSCSLLTGIGLIIWMDVEVAVIGYGSLIQAIYAALGLLILIFTLTPSVMKYYRINRY